MVIGGPKGLQIRRARLERLGVRNRGINDDERQIDSYLEASTARKLLGRIGCVNSFGEQQIAVKVSMQLVDKSQPGRDHIVPSTSLRSDAPREDPCCCA